MGLIPKNEKFFDLFEQEADNMITMGKAFHKFVHQFDRAEERIKQIHDIEHEGDILTHEIIDKLNRSYITPIDREDIQALSKAIDDVVDVIQGAADRMVMYRIETSTEALMDMADILMHSIDETAKAVKSLRTLSDSRRVLDYCIEVNRYENEGDAMLRKTMSKLFDNAKDPIELIKWKEIYECVEIALDKCEDVANVIEGIIVKNA